MLPVIPRLSSDDRLVQLAASGDDPAFGALFERHEAALLAYARAMLRNDDDARDVLQTAALKALAALRDQRLPAAPRAWLFRIVHNETITVLRRRRPHEELRDDDRPVQHGPEQTVLE